MAESAPPDDAGIGDACEDCHASVVASYRATGMARALGALRPGEFEGLGVVTEPSTGFRYHFEEHDGRARIVETFRAVPGDARRDRSDDDKGAADRRAPPHQDSARLWFAIGAGIKDRSFVAVRHGRMWFAPLETISASEAPRHAALAPPHAMSPGSRMTVPITPACLACHTDDVPGEVWPSNLVPRAADWTPRGISCAACHGHAAEHAAWRSAEPDDDARDDSDPIISFSSFDRVQRMSVCGTCHLQGDARIELDGSVHSVLAPGEDLLARRAIFVAAEPTTEIGFVSQVERLVLSRCFTESAGSARELSCETCHDPHVVLTDERERRRVRAVCRSCHSAPVPPGDQPPMVEAMTTCSLTDAEAKRGEDCVSCHMPRRPVFDVAGVEIHDHRIERRPGPSVRSETLRFFESPTGNWEQFVWPDRDPPAHANDLGLLLLALYNARIMEFATALLGAQHSPLVDALPMFHHARGVLLEGVGGLAEARAAYERALELRPEMAESSSNLGLLQGRIGELDAGLATLTSLLERAPKADGALRNRGLIQRARGDQEAFLRDVEAAMKLAPDAALALALVDVYTSLGRESMAERWRLEARRLDPRNAED